MADQRTLEEELVVANDRLKQAASLLVTRQEPMRVMQMLKYDMLLLRAEMIALRDTLKMERSLNEYQKRFKDKVDEFTGMIEESLGVHILPDLRIQEGVKSARHHKTKENSGGPHGIPPS